MRLLVTGGLGFIGSNFIRHLLEADADAEITNVDAMSYGSNPANLADLKLDRRYRFRRGDISNKDVVKALVAKADLVINFAAETHVDRSISSSLPFMKSNVFGVYTILEALRHAGGGIRFVQVGTDEEYGEIREGSFAEDDMLTPSSPYAATKASASLLAIAYARTYGLDVIVTRCTNNFGPYQYPEKLIPKTIIRAARNLPVPMYGSGRQVRDWMFVRDHCEALLQVMKRGESGEIYNVSSGNELDNLSLVKKILGIMHKETALIEHVEDRPGHDFRYSLDSTKVRKQLGWRPRHSFERALESTVRWYLEEEAWWRPLASSRTLSPAPWKDRY